MKPLLLIPLLFLAACQPQKTEQTKDESDSTPEKTEVPEATKLVSVVMKTSKGDITIELNAEKAPLTVANFLTYVDSKFYDGVIFHRVMSDFMIQGGGFELQDEIPTEKKNNDPVKNESEGGLSNAIGTIAMARTPNPDSATSQFFINVKDNSGSLDFPLNGGGYAVFGKVTAGMDVVNEIKSVNISTKYMNSMTPAGLKAGPHQNVPITPIIIESIRRTE